VEKSYCSVVLKTRQKTCHWRRAGILCATELKPLNRRQNVSDWWG